MAQLTELLEQTASLHHHLCPRQVLGVRMGMLAGELLGIALPQANKRLLTFVETDGCFADGIAVATGCTLGHRTLRLVDYGKVAAVFADAENDAAIRIYPHPASRDAAAAWVPSASNRWSAMLEAYQALPIADLFRWQPVQFKIDLKALISRHGVRVNCTYCGEEILNEREIIVDGQPLCAACAGNAYYVVQSEVLAQAHERS